MQTENDYARDVFNGNLQTVLRIDENEGPLVASFDGAASNIRSVSSMRSFPPMRRRSTNRKGPNIRGSSSPLRCNITRFLVAKVIVIGLLANTCIETTGRFATELGYHVGRGLQHGQDASCA